MTPQKVYKAAESMDRAGLLALVDVLAKLVEAQSLEIVRRDKGHEVNGKEFNRHLFGPRTERTELYYPSIHHCRKGTE